MENIKISVVLCSYNGEKYIRNQLDSILAQSIKPDEVIIGDDYSTDKTFEIICQYVNEYPEVKFVVERNQYTYGFIKNFMSTIKKASGHIIFLSDQDDIWKNNKIEEVLKVFSKYEDALAVNTSYNLIDASGNTLGKLSRNKRSRRKAPIKKISWKNYILSPRFPGMSMAIKKELLDYIGEINEELIPAHDWLLNEAASYNGGMYHLKIVLTSYRQHENNTVGIINKDSKTVLLKKREHSLKFLKNTHIAIKTIHNDNISICNLADRLLEIDEVRRENIYNKSLIKCTILYIFNYKYISKRCYLGDMYTILKL